MIGEQTLLFAVIDNPSDLDLRLVCADWLEENGQAERAEFIRVQCELEDLRERFRDSVLREDASPHDEWLHPAKPGCDCPYCTLHRLEEELLTAHTGDWLPTEWDAWSPAGQGFTRIAVSNRGGPSYECEFRRGFVEVVSCTCADWLAHGPALVRAAPLTEVWLADKEPTSGTSEFYWIFFWHEFNLPQKGYLPNALRTYFPPQPGWSFSRHYATAADAHAALSAACLAWARSVPSESSHARREA